MMYVILIFFLGYFILMTFLLAGWNRAIEVHNQAPLSEESFPFISILIPVRNEQENMIRVLTYAVLQNYPADKFEILIINDHSEDGTQEVIDSYLQKHSPNLIRLINLPGKLTGKKAAITHGVTLAQGEIIATTDADCHMQEQWLRSIARSFQPDVQMLVGPVKLANDKNFFWHSLQQMEFAALIGSGAATLSFGFPTMCNGANLAYRKTAFEAVGGYAGNEQILSGDDEFLLRKIFARFPKNVKFNLSPGGLVSANPSPSITEFINQRLRWASKWRAHGLGASSFLALFIFMFHAVSLSLIPLVILGYVTIQDAALLVGGKLAFEAVYLYRVLRFTGIFFNPLSFLLLQIVYPLYVIFIGLAVNFLKPEWKGGKI